MTERNHNAKNTIERLLTLVDTRPDPRDPTLSWRDHAKRFPRGFAAKTFEAARALGAEDPMGGA